MYIYIIIFTRIKKTKIMKTKELYKNIESKSKEFAAKAYKIRSKKGLIELWHTEYTALKKKYSPHTIKTYASTYYRTDLIKRYGVNFSLKYEDLKDRLKTTKKIREKQFIWIYSIVKLPNTERGKLENKYKDKIEKRTKKPYEIINTVEMIEIAKNLLNSESYADITLALCFLTGRRPIEVLKIGRISKISRFELKYKGKAKTKTKSDINKIYTIPCLTDSETIVLGWKKLRKLKKFSKSTNIEVHNSTSRTLHNKVSKLFDFGVDCNCSICKGGKKKKNKEYCFKLKTYSLRYAYVQICKAVFNKDKSSANNYISKILLHSKGDFDTANSYQDFTISYSEKQKLRAYFSTSESVLESPLLDTVSSKTNKKK